METVIMINNVSKSFQKVGVIKKMNMKIQKNEFVAIVGPSGCGKSTLLNLIGLLDKQDSGDIILFDNKNVKPFSRKAEKLLKERIGYLFQNYALIENQNVKYNLEIVFDYSIKKEERNKRIQEALELVGLSGFEAKKVYKCSGGEQQRIAMARLLLKQCDLILADEPTGNLDLDNKEKVFNILKELNKMGKTIVLVTHDKELAEQCTRVLQIEDSGIKEEK